jgi:hypothetical protein
MIQNPKWQHNNSLDLSPGRRHKGLSVQKATSNVTNRQRPLSGGYEKMKENVIKETCDTDRLSLKNLNKSEKRAASNYNLNTSAGLEKFDDEL